MRQAFVFFPSDVSLRQVVAQVRSHLGDEMPNWGRYFCLFRLDGAYACIGLGSLSGQLEQQAWKLDTPLSAFHYQPCARRSLFGDDDSPAPFVVTEREGEPIKLDLVGALTPGMNRTGWWKLVGAYLAELGELPEWPDLQSAGFVLIPVIQVEAETTLGELGHLLVNRTDLEDRDLAIRWMRPMQWMQSLQNGQPGQWVFQTVRDLRQQIMDLRPQPAANSQVGAFIDPSRAQLTCWNREHTPWPLVAEFFRASSHARVLVLQNGYPIGVLSRHPTMRSAPSHDGDTTSQSAPVKSLADLLFRLETVQPGQQDRGRVVNTWFADARQQHVAPACALAANTIYHLGVNIGESDPSRSNMKGEQLEIGAHIVRYAAEQEIALTLDIDSEDFIILESTKVIYIPQAGTTKDIFFRLATPVKTGLGEIRLRIYLENNLIQSYAICAHIAPMESEIPDRAIDGWWAECEYTLSAGFTNLDDFRYRRICIWLGKGREQVRTGMTGIMEAGLVSELNPVFLANALAHYRQLLEDASIDKTGQTARYLYQDDLTPADPAVFDRCIRSLAELGQMLCFRVFGESNGREIAQRLHSIEQTQPEPMIVQIARLNLDLPFPWDVLYDRPLVYHPHHNVVCHGFVDDTHCQESCPHVQDGNVICPYGFWGFRYIIEQPLRPPNAYPSVSTKVQVSSTPPKMTIVYGPGLGLTEQHQYTVRQIAGDRARIEQLSSVDELLAALKSIDDLPAAVYLYCHGGNTAYSQWLVLGDDEPLRTIHLDDEVRRAWTASLEDGRTAPLVVLNGCHTGKYDTATLLSFIHQFARLGAAGVIGTEIPIHEYMGKRFGEFWVERFLNGEPVGQIIYDFRQQLLQKQNVLGLAYVPYCYADLRLELEAN